ncbi:HAUS augmin-like complex subunit 4 [Patagioenas fasciata]|uniref:HAUS augmin-like complex subunit 4 n=1 Tax=Patagioenas fasciata TaxID=372321 RepID=UPI003A99DB57
MAAADIEGLLEEEPLQQLHPGLAPLRGIGGVGAELEREVRQAWAGLALARSQWLRWEGLWAGLQELLRQDPARFRQVEQTLVLTQLRQGDPLMTSLPPPEDPAPFHRLLLPALELHLKQKTQGLADYHGGGACKQPMGSATNQSTSGGVAQALANEMQCLGHAHRRSRALQEQLSHHRRLLPQVLARVATTLGRLLGSSDAWTQRDWQRGLYLEAKGVALLLKIRLEELRVLLETYPPDLVEAHRSIRSLLQSERSQVAAASSHLQEALGAFRSLGPEFEAQVREFRRLRQRLRDRQWVLRQLHPPAHGHTP